MNLITLKKLDWVEWELNSTITFKISKFRKKKINGKKW